MKKLIPFAAGFTTAVLVLLLVNTVIASNTVIPGTSSTITVLYSPMKTIVNGKEYTPDNDMIPFIYNNRTFVSLKFIGEALGKDVTWDQAANAAVISDPIPFTNVYSDPLTAVPLSRDWTKSGTVNPDPVNGVSIPVNSSLTLDKYYKRDARNYTVEFDLARDEYAAPIITISRTKAGRSSDMIQFHGHYNYVSINKQRNNFPAGVRMPVNEFRRVKIEVTNGMIDVYIDGAYIASDKHLGEEVYIQFSSGVTMIGTCYVRNFQLTITE